MKLKAISTVLFRCVHKSPPANTLDIHKVVYENSRLLSIGDRSRSVLKPSPRSNNIKFRSLTLRRPLNSNSFCTPGSRSNKLGKGEAVEKHFVTQETHVNMTTSVDLDLGLGKKELRLPNFASVHPSNHAIHGDQLERDMLSGVEEFQDVVSSCAGCLARGGVIAVPTDTIYGVACLVQNTKAVNSLYDIKQRNFKNPVAISVAGIDDIYRWSNVTVPREILEDLLPGPVTVVFERKPDLNPALNPHTNLIGLRIPNHKFMKALAKECGSPVALTSANISGASSCLQIKEFSTLWPRLDLVVNGGTLSDSEESRLGSTVVDLSVPGKFRIIRPGSAHVPTLTCLKEKYSLEESLQSDTGKS